MFLMKIYVVFKGEGCNDDDRVILVMKFYCFDLGLFKVN